MEEKAQMEGLVEAQKADLARYAALVADEKQFDLARAHELSLRTRAREEQMIGTLRLKFIEEMTEACKVGDYEAARKLGLVLDKLRVQPILVSHEPRTGARGDPQEEAERIMRKRGLK